MFVLVNNLHHMATWWHLCQVLKIPICSADIQIICSAPCLDPWPHKWTQLRLPLPIVPIFSTRNWNPVPRHRHIMRRSLTQETPRLHMPPPLCPPSPLLVLEQTISSTVYASSSSFKDPHSRYSTCRTCTTHSLEVVWLKQLKCSTRTDLFKQSLVFDFLGNCVSHHHSWRKT